MRRSIAPRAISIPPPVDPTRVTADDVARIDIFQAILTTLNDPRASATSLIRDVARLPVLAARIEALYKKRVGSDRPVPRLIEQIARLGNRELEGVLLELLEDVVILGSELAETRRATGSD